MEVTILFSLDNWDSFFPTFQMLIFWYPWYQLIIVDLFLASILKFCPYFWDPRQAPMLCMAVLAYLHYLTCVCLGVYCHVYLLSVIYIECTVIHNAHLWVPLLERDNVTNRYKIFTFIITIFFYPYNTINIIHKCTFNCKNFLMGSSSSNFYSLSNLMQFFFCLLSFLSSPILTNL